MNFSSAVCLLKIVYGWRFLNILKLNEYLTRDLMSDHGRYHIFKVGIQMMVISCKIPGLFDHGKQVIFL